MDIARLKKAEDSIKELLQVKESNWKNVAKIALIVREKELYRQSKLNSFSAWVEAIANECERQPSLFWRYIRAATYYLDLVRSEDVRNESVENAKRIEDIDDLDSAAVSPETIVNLQKVEKTAPSEVYEKLKLDVLSGKATVRQSRAIEQEFRPERPNNNKRFGFSNASAAASAAASTDATSKIENDSDNDGIARNKIASTIVKSLKENLNNWTKDCARMKYPPSKSAAYSEVRVNLERKRLRLDLVGIVRWSNKKPKDIFGIEIKSSLADFDRDMKWENYLYFCHYFCFAVLDENKELVRVIEERVSDYIGILTVDRSNRVTIYRQPKKLEPKYINKLYETLFERAAGWSGSDADADADADAN